MRRKGLGKGLGQGYKNLVSIYDSHVHSLSAKGVKSHRFVPDVVSTRRQGKGIWTCVDCPEQRDAKEMIKHYPKPKYDKCNAGHQLVEIYDEKRNTYVWDCPICIRKMERARMEDRQPIQGREDMPIRETDPMDFDTGFDAKGEKLIYDNLSRKKAIDFLVEEGYKKEKLGLMSDDVLAYMYDAVKRSANSLDAKGKKLYARGLSRSQKYRRQYSYVRSKGLLDQIGKLKTVFPDLKTEIEKSKTLSATNRIIKVGGKTYRVFLKDGGHMSTGASVIYPVVYDVTDDKMIMTSKDIASWMPPIAYIYADIKGIEAYEGAKQLGY